MPKIRVEIEVPKGPYCHHGKRANDGDGQWCLHMDNYGDCNVFGDNDRANHKHPNCVAAIKAAKETK